MYISSTSKLIYIKRYNNDRILIYIKRYNNIIIMIEWSNDRMIEFWNSGILENPGNVSIERHLLKRKDVKYCWQDVPAEGIPKRPTKIRNVILLTGIDLVLPRLHS